MPSVDSPSLSTGNKVIHLECPITQIPTVEDRNEVLGDDGSLNMYSTLSAENSKEKASAVNSYDGKIDTNKIKFKKKECEKSIDVDNLSAQRQEKIDISGHFLAQDFKDDQR